MMPLFTCSIDDGHPSDLKMAELLARHGLHATFFIPIRNREGPPVLAGSDMRALAARFEIGSHTHDHCYLSRISPATALHQIKAGKQRLEDEIGKPAAGFCYPGGEFNTAHAQMVRACGFEYARTTVNLLFDAGDKRFEMPTTIQFYPHRWQVYLRNYLRAGCWNRRTAALRLALRHDDWVQRIFALFDFCCEHGALFHLWAHSMEIDRLDAWSELGSFMAHVAASVPPAGRLTNRQLAWRTWPSAFPLPEAGA
jgi:hypothetical protein